MADDEPSDPKFFETVPRVRGGFSAIGSAGAPFIYFDNVPFFGLMNGVAQITLDANRLWGADSESRPIIDRVIVAHLRTTLPAVRALRAALDAVILMAEQKPEGPTN
jgi:hypothetical protein